MRYENGTNLGNEGEECRECREFDRNLGRAEERITTLETENAKLLSLIAKERDEFGAQETRLRAKLKGAEAEAERLSGKTGFCRSCEDYAIRLARTESSLKKYREALETIAKAGTIPWKDSDAMHVKYWAWCPKEALSTPPEAGSMGTLTGPSFTPRGKGLKPLYCFSCMRRIGNR